MAEQPSFEEVIEMWVDAVKSQIGGEVMEGGSIAGKDPPYPSLILDARTIRKMSGWIGDRNPLYNDPAYAAKTKYGCLLAHPTILMGARYTTSHGPTQEDLPPIVRGLSVFANMFAGTLFEWYDVIPLGTRFWTSLRHREYLEKKGAKGRLLFTVTEGFYWNQRGDILGKARGHEIFIPMESRTGHDTERIGDQMLYERPIQSYTPEEIEKIKKDLDAETIRGAKQLYWEDVNINDTLPPIIMGPYQAQDQTGYRAAVADPARLELFELQINAIRETELKFIHPISLWPWTESGRVEHEDPILCRYRGLPGPFDYGAHRVCYGGRLITDWMGNDGFMRKMYLDLRKFKYYGDTTYFTGTIVAKYKVTEKGEAGKGGVPGEVEYCAVDIQINAMNQIGEKTVYAKATVYLPSRESGPVTLPIPHMARPPGIYTEPTPEYIPFPKYHMEEAIVSMAGKFQEKKVS